MKLCGTSLNLHEGKPLRDEKPLFLSLVHSLPSPLQPASNKRCQRRPILSKRRATHPANRLSAVLVYLRNLHHQKAWISVPSVGWLEEDDGSLNKIRSGEVFTLRTTDPKNLPLPSKELLEMHCYLHWWLCLVLLDGQASTGNMVRGRRHFKREKCTGTGEGSEKPPDRVYRLFFLRPKLGLQT